MKSRVLLLSKFVIKEINVYSKQYLKISKQITYHKTFISNTADNLLDDFDFFSKIIFLCFKLMFKFVINNNNNNDNNKVRIGLVKVSPFGGKSLQRPGGEQL